MKSLVLLGADGYIGQNLVQDLCDKFKLKVFIHDPKKINLFENIENVEVFSGDVLVPEDLEKVISKGDVIVNLVGTTTLNKKDDQHFAVNVIGQNNIAKICAEKKTSVIYFSTINIYKNTNKKSEEADEIEPTDVYSLSKHMGERLYEFYSREFDLPVVVLRVGSVYGPGQGKGLVFTMSKSLKKEGSIKIPGSEVVRDLIYIDDLIDATEKAIFYIKKGFHVFNISSGKGETLHDIARTITGLKKGKVIEDPKRTAHPLSVTVSINKAKKELDFEPKIPLPEGLRKALSSYKIIDL